MNRWLLEISTRRVPNLIIRDYRMQVRHIRAESLYKITILRGCYCHPGATIGEKKTHFVPRVAWIQR